MQKGEQYYKTNQKTTLVNDKRHKHSNNFTGGKILQPRHGAFSSPCHFTLLESTTFCSTLTVTKRLLNGSSYKTILLQGF